MPKLAESRAKATAIFWIGLPVSLPSWASRRQDAAELFP